jgi:uncharacterized membrane protein
MIVFPIAFFVFLLFFLALPVIFGLAYFGVITMGFGSLGISSQTAFILLFSILLGSAVNIPLTKKKFVYTEKRSFFGLWRQPKLLVQCVSINLGGAVIPILLSIYFLIEILLKGFSLKPVLIAMVLMIIISNFLSRMNPGRGITISAVIPPIFAAVFAMILAPDFAASCAFVSGVLGVLIGADLLNIKRIQSMGSGFISIGGAGVFDGIFLIGIASSLLTNL